MERKAESEYQWKTRMVKSCCVVGCNNAFVKGGRSFYNFPADKELRSKWIAAVRRENWTPNESTVICSDHFVTGVRNKEDPLAPNSVPRLFSYVKSPEKRRLEREMMESYKRRQALKKRRRLALDAMSKAPEKYNGRSATVMQQKNNEEPNEEVNGESNEEVNGESNAELNEEDSEEFNEGFTSNDNIDSEESTGSEDNEMEVVTNKDEAQNEGLLELAQEFRSTNHLLLSTVTELLETRKLLAEAVHQKTEVKKQLLLTVRSKEWAIIVTERA